MKKAVFVAAAVIFLYSCGTPYGVYHTVKKGQTLYRIAKTYGVKMEDIIVANRLDDPEEIKEGQVLFIPGADHVLDVKPYTSETASSPEKSKHSQTYSLSRAQPRSSSSSPNSKIQKHPSKGKGRFVWPVVGTITSGFGRRNGRPHDGIDISAPEGTPIRAAADGRVVYSGDELKGYGNLIVIKHTGNFFTVYAHNQVNLVKEGDFVKQGDIIGRVGQTGRITGPHLHFEIRRGKIPVNPLLYLP